MSENAENQIGEQNSSLKEESITTEEKPVADNKPSEIPEKENVQNVQNNSEKDSDTIKENYELFNTFIKKYSEKKKQLETELNNKKEYLEKNLAKFDTENYFQNDKFKELYSEAFNLLGTSLDTDKFISLLDGYVNSRMDLVRKQELAKKENENITDSLAFNSGVSPKKEKLLRMQDIPSDELEKYIAKYV